ncbi:MAG: DUF4190 domain-containing protein, partial [Acidobacteria bacterium]|nr:DUF4190 domain-containing protein [Acidobacteriota bacterium]
VKAEKVGGPPPATFDEPIGESPQQEAWSPPPAPIEEIPGNRFGDNAPVEVGSAETSGTNQTLAIVSLALGILSLICGFGFLTGVPAIITGYMARNKVKESPNEYGGGTMALIGMILGALGTVIVTAISILYVVLVIMAS